MTLAAFLTQGGYVQIPLSRNGVGHFQVGGSLNGRDISVLIDTGAASTVFSLQLVQSMNLPLTRLAMAGGGAGSARLDVYEIREASFRLADLSPRVQALLAMDLSHVDEALKSRNSTGVEAILGIDALDAHSAIIDYGSSTLFLKKG
jgi:hypothetical protein